MAERKVRKKFKKWWGKHQDHLILKDPYTGVAWCEKCKIVAPRPFKEDS